MLWQLVGQGAQILIALAGAYLIAFWFVLVVWTFRDIESRSRSVVAQVFSTLMVVLFFVPGVLLYLILRPKETLDEAFQRSLEEEYLLQDLEELPLCPGCHRYVEDDFVLCPHCHAELREPCATCSRLVDLRWALCPYCAAVQHGRVEADGRVEAPAPRWVAPQLRRRRATPDWRPEEAVAGPEVAVPADATAEPARPVPEPVPVGRTSSVLVAGMRSVVRPFGRFRPREEVDGSVAAEATELVPADAVPGEFDPALSNGRTVGAEARRFFQATNGSSDYPANGVSGNGSGINGSGADQDEATDGAGPVPERADSAVIASWGSPDGESAETGADVATARTRRD